MRKLIFLGCVFLSINAFAYEYECECEKKAYDPCAYDADLFKKCEKVSFVNAEFLYWTAEATSLEYAVKNNTTPPAGTTYAIGNYEVAKYDWDPGFRISYGYFNAPHYWQVLAQFTYLRIRGSDSVSKPSDNLNGTWPEPFSSNMNDANSRLKLNNEILDLLTSRVFITNPHLRMRLFGGISGARLKQEWTVNYLYTTDSNRIFNKWKFLSGGLKIGFDFDWFWGNNFYLTGKTSAGALIGKYKNFWVMSPSTSGQSVADVEYSDYRIAYLTQFLFGFSYQKAFTNNRLEAFLGYELNSWFNVHEVIKTTGDGTASNARVTSTSNGTLSMHGLTARFTLDF